ncbi:MAG: XF1762 family protein [Pyrinomonadaceae bacterium]
MPATNLAFTDHQRRTPAAAAQHQSGFDPCPWCAGFDVALSHYDPITREYELEFCCDLSAEEWDYEIKVVGIPRKAWRRFFKNHGLDVRQVTPGRDGEMYLDWGLQLHDVDRKTAQAFVNNHHRHCKASAGDRVRLCAMNGPDMVAVCVAGRPVARHIDQFSVLEVTRLCVRHDLEIPGLVWNACSQLYAEMARRATSLGGINRVITYTLRREEGTALKALGWTPLYVTAERPDGWNCAARPREPGATDTSEKICWEYRLVEGLDHLNATAREWRLARRVPTFGRAYEEELAAQIRFTWAA